jgi:hypothetical protein
MVICSVQQTDATEGAHCTSSLTDAMKESLGDKVPSFVEQKSLLFNIYNPQVH